MRLLLSHLGGGGGFFFFFQTANLLPGTGMLLSFKNCPFFYGKSLGILEPHFLIAKFHLLFLGFS